MGWPGSFFLLFLSLQTWNSINFYCSCWAWGRKVKGKVESYWEASSAKNDEVHFIAANSKPKIPVVQEGFPTHTGNSAIAQHSINDLYTPHHCFCSLAEPGCVNKGISGKRVPACWVVLLSAVDAAFINQKNLELYSLPEPLRVFCLFV